MNENDGHALVPCVFDHWCEDPRRYFDAMLRLSTIGFVGNGHSVYNKKFPQMWSCLNSLGEKKRSPFSAG